MNLTTKQLKSLIGDIIKESVSMKTDSEFMDGVTNTMAAVNMEEEKVPGTVYLDDLKIEFSKREKNLMSIAVNSFATGGHQMSTNENILDFSKDYVIQMLKKALNYLNRNKKYVKDYNDIKLIIDKILKNKIQEDSCTGGVAGYSTPYAFTKNPKGSPKRIQAAAKYGKVVDESPRV